MSSVSLQAIALDDEPSALEVIEEHSRKTEFLELQKTFLSPSKAMEYLQKNKIDLLFLDIEMPDINGIELAKMINTQVTKVILVTAYDHYALAGFEVQAVDYLVKPVTFDRFLKACLKVKETLNEKSAEAEFIFVKDGYQLRRIKLDEILFIKSDANWLNIYTKRDRVVTRMTLSKMMESLPAQFFFRVHKSFIVNLRFAEKIDQQFVYIGKEEIPISGAHRQPFQEAVNKYLKV